MNEQYIGKNRFTFFIILLSLATLGILGRYGYLMLREQQSRPYLRTELISGRGPILDRNGRILAMETRIGDISLWRPSIRVSYAELAGELAPILEIPARDIQDRIENSRSDFIYLRRQVDEPTIRLVEAAMSEGRIRGVSIEPTLNRVYPEGGLASQILGFTTINVSNSNELTGRVTNTSREGIAGIEFAYNNELSPSMVPSLPGTRRRQNGNQIYLTLDINVQHILERIAGQVYRQTNAEAVMFMAMDPRTGDILGSASLPSFDPNNLSNPSEMALMDRPTIWAYEPGSAFKIFSMAALMDERAVTHDAIFMCNGRYERVTNRGERIVINCLGNHGPVTVRDIIIHSCNAGAAYATDRMGPVMFDEILREFGFGFRTGAGNPGETMGFFRTSDRWSERSKPTIAIGQEIAVSALQMMQAATAIANNGVLVSPRIISRIVSPDDRTVHVFQGNQPRQILRPETARAMLNYMMDVTSSMGTGWRAYVDDLSLAVKTGTAQVIDNETRAYSTTDFISSAIAILPAESPSLVLYLVIIKPQGEILAGRIAAPPIRDAADELINYLGIPRGRNPQVAHPGIMAIPEITYPAVVETVPDFIGLSKRQLLPLLLRDDLQLRVSGDGWVRYQTPLPNTPLGPDTLIFLELE